MKIYILILVCVFAPLKPSSCSPIDQRKARALYYNYMPSNDYDFDNLDLEDSGNYVNEDDIARAISPSGRKVQKVIPGNAFNSPIYYIALPPQPYIFVPGMGYMSQPSNPSSNFLNLPINFLANGKPSNIYQWSANNYQNPHKPTTTKKPMEHPKPTDSPIINLDNKFVFNGKPSDTISILRDSYNALYSDALQNFYP
ncbi:uncharacterized protein LOC123316953 isoform X1 [Coccinella septempunctata]|uniref:uncharacterized protein LOC123316953 isoform X1 n=1 Tax=Coccinella septempunctata TaxID=41139 RepID=UPI001D07EECF|nr:uncharacterized protein LOC123316953 isoform X1 [Coccinella septempunctata]